MSSKIMIAISGKSGCGNTSVSRIVAERLGLRLINYTFHNFAEELEISFQKLLVLAAKDTSYDIELDNRQLALAREGNCVLGSRLAIWLLEEATLKVYLDATPEVRAERIARREKRDVVDVLRETAERDGDDRKRFLNLYGIDNDCFQFADLVIDTEKGDEVYVADKIVERIRR